MPAIPFILCSYSDNGSKNIPSAGDSNVVYDHPYENGNSFDSGDGPSDNNQKTSPKRTWNSGSRKDIKQGGI